MPSGEGRGRRPAGVVLLQAASLSAHQFGLYILCRRAAFQAKASGVEPPVTVAQADAMSRVLNRTGTEFGPFGVGLRQDGV